MNLTTEKVCIKNEEVNDTALLKTEAYANLPRNGVSPEILKEKFFNGIDGPKLNLIAIYALFHREDSTAFKIGRKWFWPTRLFISWWESQAGNKGIR